MFRLNKWSFLHVNAIFICFLLALSSAVVVQASSDTGSGQSSRLPWRGNHVGRGFYDRFIKGHLYLAPGATYVDFDHLKSSDLRISGARFPTTLATRNGPIAGAKATVDNKTIPTISIGYFLPYTHHHLSLNTIIGAPIHFHISGRGALSDRSLAPDATLGSISIPTGIPALGSDIAKVKTLPFTVTLLYHPFPNAVVQPYIGGGGVYIYNYDAKITNAILTEENQPSFDISDTWGYVLEAGFDVGQKNSRGFYGFGDVRYFGGTHVEARAHNVHVRVRNQELGGLLGLLGYSSNSRVGNTALGLDLNALIFTVGVGYRF